MRVQHAARRFARYGAARPARDRFRSGVLHQRQRQSGRVCELHDGHAAAFEHRLRHGRRGGDKLSVTFLPSRSCGAVRGIRRWAISWREPVQRCACGRFVKLPRVRALRFARNGWNRCGVSLARCDHGGGAGHALAPVRNGNQTSMPGRRAGIRSAHELDLIQRELGRVAIDCDVGFARRQARRV